MSNKKILLIGGRGFIGSHLERGLIKKGYNVVVADIKDNVNLDIEKVFEKEKPDIVYNLAGAIGLKRGNNDSGVERVKIICNLCRRYGAKLIFFSSGGAIYNNPESEYARANLEIERCISKEPGSLILRLSNVYGPEQWKEGIIPQIIKGNPKIKGDGNQARDFIYISDVVDASIIGINKQGIYNIGFGKTYRLNEVVNIIRKYKEVNVEYFNGKDVNAKELKPDLDNWQPKVSLEKGLIKTIEWKSKN